MQVQLLPVSCSVSPSTIKMVTGNKGVISSVCKCKIMKEREKPSSNANTQELTLNQLVLKKNFCELQLLKNVSSLINREVTDVKTSSNCCGIADTVLQLHLERAPHVKTEGSELGVIPHEMG